MKAGVTVLAGVAFLAGCAPGQGGPPATTTQTTQCYLDNNETVDCLPRPRIEKMRQDEVKRYFAHEPWAQSKDRPQIGVALMGGGSQASSFSVGVLKRLVDSGEIHNIDLLSSVSGGGYAALYLYTRERYNRAYNRVAVRDQKLKSLFESHFQLCYNRKDETENDKRIMLPVRSRDLVDYYQCAPGAVDENCGLPEKRLRTQAWCERFSDCIRNSPDGQYNPAHSLSFTGCYQDVLSNRRGDYSRSTSFPPLDQLLDDLLRSTVALPIHLTANVLFDAQYNISASRESYRHGLWRAYGHVQTCWVEGKRQGEATSDGHVCSDDDWDALRSGLFNEVSRAFRYSELAEFGRGPAERRLPMWILNAGTPTRAPLDFRYADLTRMDDYRFEFTPFGFGSHRYNFVKASPDRIGVDVMTALLSSVAFLDPSQRTQSTVVNAAGQLLLTGLNWDWSVAIPNYTLPEEKRRQAGWRPLPLNLASHEPGGRGKIHLGDGGVTRDNFGLISLLERGTRNIIMIDHVEDRVGDRNDRTVGMHALCNVAAFLHARRFRMIFFGHPNDSKDDAEFDIHHGCRMGEGEANFYVPSGTNAGYLKYRNWQRPIWRGVIKSMDNDATLAAHGVQLHLVKTALVEEDFIVADGKHCKRKDCFELAIDDLSPANINAPENPRTRHDQPPVPAILRAWWLEGGTSGGNSKETNKGGLFPQDGMAVMTLNSSQSLFNAYMELGNYLATGLPEIIRGIKESGQ